MRILHVLASSLGGGASHVYDLVAHKADGFEQRLVVSSDGGTIANQLRSQGHQVDELDLAKGWKWGALCHLIRIIREFRPAVVHCHGFRAGLYGRVAAKLAWTNNKVVLTVHGFHYLYYRCLKKWLLIGLELCMKPLTHYVIAVSKTDWRHLIDYRVASKAKSQVILNGVSDILPSSLQRNEIRKKLGLSDGPVIATVARLQFQKGGIYFLEAIPSILRSYPESQFLMVGDGPDREMLQQMAVKLKIQDRVLFLGNRDDVHDILNALDLFVLPSLWEGLPLCLLEAIRAKVPVIATDVDGNRDVIENEISGLLIPPKNGEAIAQAVLKMLREPTLAKRYVEQASLRLKKDFSFIGMLQQTRRVYKSLYT